MPTFYALLKLEFFLLENTENSQNIYIFAVLL